MPAVRNGLPKLKEFQQSIEHHVQEEEGKVFPAAKKVFSDDQAQQMAQQYMEFKKNFMQQGAMAR